MVPDNSNNSLAYISILDTLSNITDELLKISHEKKDFIINQDWDSLSVSVYEQEELNVHLDRIISRLNNDKSLSSSNNNSENIKIIKEKIKEKLIIFREMENLNRKLLKDAFYVAKKKVEIYFNSPNNDDTYKRELKKELSIWGNSSILLDRTV